MSDHSSRRAGDGGTGSGADRDTGWYQALLGATSDVVVVLDADGTVDYASPSVRHVLGHDPDDLVGASAFELVHPADRNAAVEQFFENAESDLDEPPVIEFEAVTADGETVMMEGVGRDRLDEPPIDGFVVSAREVTERRAREQDLAEYETILETAPVGLVTLDADHVITWANDVHARTLGLSREEFVGEPFLDLIEQGYHDESLVDLYLDTVRDLLSSSVDLDKANYLVETHLPSGETLLHDVYMTLLPLEDGEFRGSVSAFRDVTTQKRYERELERQNERLDAFTSVVSHDLRNPLNVAQGHLELAMETGDREAVETARRAQDRMEALIEDLLTLAREQNEVQDPIAVDLGTVARNAWASVDTGNATMTVADDVGTVPADSSRLQQAFENLFRNALEHGAPDDVDTGGSPTGTDDAGVSLTVGQLEDGTGFFVEDDGPGIPEEVREQVFERGFTTERNGTGFGLAIVREIVEAHGWSITAVAAEGARFEVTGVEPAEG